jgi:hypothetical protein
MNSHYQKYKNSIREATKKFYHKRKQQLKDLKEFEKNVKEILEGDLPDNLKIDKLKELMK